MRQDQATGLAGSCRSSWWAPAVSWEDRLSILGTRVLRSEDPLFLTTGATYTEDLVDERLTGALHATFVRSPIAAAKILSIDVSAALEAPGVVAVFTGDEIDDVPAAVPSMPMFPAQMGQPLLAKGVVRYVGQPVAVVLTEDPYQGEDAAELVDVDYEPMTAVVDPHDARTDANLLHPDAGTNTVWTIGLDGPAFSPDGEKEFFDGCDVIVTQQILNQRVAPAPMETRSAAAVWHTDDEHPDGRLIMWLGNQGAQGTKRSLIAALGLDEAQLRVITPATGGAFGAKFGADGEHAIVGWLARRLARPVRWSETRSENMVAMTHGRAQIQTVTVGGTREGKVLAYRIEVLQDAGAYPRMGALLPILTGLMAPGVYAFPRAEAVATSVVTNTTPVGAYRGAGRPEATAAVERAMDLFAAEIGVDPAEVRRKNLLPAFTEPHTTAFGAVYDSGDYVTALERALAAAGYEDLRAEQAKRRASGDEVQLGIGLSCYVEITGAGGEAGGAKENATVEVHPDGSATILTGTSPHGQGHQTVWAMLASEELGIPVDRITLKWGDTDLIPEGGGTGGSRSLQQGGAAVQQASRDLLDVARQRAADELEANPADLVFDLARSAFAVAGDPDAAVPLARLAEHERLFVRAVFTAPGATFPFGAHVAVAEVDTETGKAVLRRVVTVDDAGTVMNPLLAEGQRHGGIAQGVAQALLEEVVYYADGNPLTSSFSDYAIVTATEVPTFELADMETPTTYNPLGAKGIGEAGTIGSTPAVQNAIIDAVAHLGVRHIDMPASPRRVWEALRAASGPEAPAPA
ncbi:MAG: xanthine dehydrogenase family protein molybdopterin-binding subunit [Nocardioidaceae bacterium]